jgi:hypothetical protein
VQTKFKNHNTDGIVSVAFVVMGDLVQKKGEAQLIFQPALLLQLKYQLREKK